MRLGSWLFDRHDSPESWVKALQAGGYRAALCPVEPGTDEATLQAYRKAAEEADIVIAEVGAWSNPLSPDDDKRREALDKCQQALALADHLGAVCCVNIAGSRGERWDGPHPGDLTPETFDLIVATVREIIDAVRPTRAFYTLEPMPWLYPDSPDSYLRLIQAIDRPAFAAHLDPVNWINSPERYFHNAAFLRECFARLGPYIKSCHAKDTILRDALTVHLDEVRPGLGMLDYRVYLTELDKLGADMPLIIEHIQREDAQPAADYIRQVAREVGARL